VDRHGRERLSRAAKVMAAAGRWDDAAAHWEQLATAGGGGAAWLQAGDALRRADRPAGAVRALTAAQSIGGVNTVLCGALLAGVLVDIGECRRAVTQARRALAAARAPAEAALARDPLIASLLLLGELDAARVEICALARGTPGGRIGACFREAELLKLDGRFTAALERRARGSEACGDAPMLRGPAAAAAQARGEILLLAGSPGPALDALDAALEGWTQAGRRVGVFGVEAARARARLRAGQLVLPQSLDRPLLFAEERQLRLLEIELCCARGLAAMARNPAAAGRDFTRAVAAASESGARLMEGRARVRWAEAGADIDRALTARLLAGDGPWTERLARLAQP